MRHDQPRRPTDDHNPNYVTVTDIETIVENEPADGSFPPWPRHIPVAACVLRAACWPGHAAFSLDTLTCSEGDEPAFYTKLDKLLNSEATLVTFNGRAFDLNVLRLSAMSARQFALPGLARLAHSNRYGDRHADLCDLFGAYGATRGHPLAELCHRLQIPVKTSVSGGDVGALWRAGEHASVVRYVEEDVAATYLLWLHWLAARHADPMMIAGPLAAFAAWLEDNPALAHLHEFACAPIARWARPLALAGTVARARDDAALRLRREEDERSFLA
ncbi:ribonuclease H-like domain-containing protein [Sphingomonas profundi]|uniref:ribonuclease H-like domain-containing protein n=1 Tax=Alterirhizorhabdus profundi TaxID=2681549 RepID=UPI0012E779AF|nr:hypothetical protein [Sphingomonas profundi]